MQVTPSRFNSLAHREDGSLLLFNSRTGAFGLIDASDVSRATDALRAGTWTDPAENRIVHDLHSAGFLVESRDFEERHVEVQYREKYGEQYLHLILMPTEQCNFRCVYCYEEFKRGTMEQSVQDGLVTFVSGQAELAQLDVNWFGGEPLLAPEVVLSMSRRLREVAGELGATAAFSMTTNGYLLTPQMFDDCLDAGVQTFQISLDGLKDEHDCKRVAVDGDGTYDVIMQNLRAMRTTDRDFLIMLRHNFDPASLQRLGPFLDVLAEEFAGDPRFATFFHAIGKWGGPNDDDLDVCEGRAAAHALIDAQRLAAQRGFRDGVMANQFRPNGFTCYAGDPRSFVVGPTGELYKCTVELDTQQRNIIGEIYNDGSMTIDWPRLSLWTETNGRMAETKCGTCHFSPTCHGSVCPQEWMDSDLEDVACPPHKQVVRESLPLLYEQMSMPEPPVTRILG